ncbi:hypothetical protein GGR42_000211 [Saonia flava]|uniref:Fibronectin type-III domain-containing protein n=1 Tax=Saonia flava TaxID=523696 RepID=A0A846QYQ6_9FLAO|nr:hypothetical protein [Saonia flava]NJB69749.1 hypothetical protein [Saonia flava]
MRNVLFATIILLLFYGCSTSDSPEEVEKITVNLPTLTTLAVTDIEETSATVGGNISNNGGANVSERGVVWATTPNPTENDNKLLIGTGTGNFSSTLSDLEENTEYFIKAYATNSKGTTYGEEQSFTTLQPEPVQKIYEGTIDLNNQDLVESFGAEGYTEITGDLRIFGTVTDLSPLSSIELLGGDLIVSNASNLVSVNGLENLVSTGNVVQFISNDLLTDISALADLSVTTAIFFIGNDALQTISGFSQTKSLNSLLRIDNNASLETISGFHNLEMLGTNLQITNNPVLTDLSGFSNLTSLSGGQAELWLNNNDSLTDITPLSSLEMANGIVISGNAMLKEINIFNLLSSLKFVEITNNRELTSIQGFDSLTNLDWQIQIDSNILLTSITAFSNLTSVGERFQIRNNSVLDDFCIFNNLIINGFSESFIVSSNLYNPTLQDMIDGNCKL